MVFLFMKSKRNTIKFKYFVRTFHFYQVQIFLAKIDFDIKKNVQKLRKLGFYQNVVSAIKIVYANILLNKK